ncbi:MAG: AAA family ATPase [Gammaproteobacteria bacterium RIFCSPHIGHO2_12_FULL_41_20]|nr:MAG: AAA family ATPase [Gammaproteobacteria bacterium RIFCSPHIGHO2_12_FULL_41_20]
MWARTIEKELRTAASEYPVVTIIGPRQSGKTTVVKKVFPKKAYANLEAMDIRAFAETDPRGFLQQYPKGAVLDEIQRVPQLLSYIQVDVDAKKQRGRFILTGSHQLSLHEKISQSLAGRTAILSLLPLSISELSAAGFDLSLNDYLLNGFMPRVYADQLNPTKAYRNYVQTYIERDVRQMQQIKDLKVFQNFLKLCAGRIGSVLNRESLGNDTGISGNTVNQWLSVLEASFILFQLPPYFENFGKRVIKAPKLYFTDVGLATYLLGIESLEQLARDPLRGFLVENLVILELIKARLNRGLEPNLYYYRDNHKNEVDVVFKQSHNLIPIEIKAAQTFMPEQLKGLLFYLQLAQKRAARGYLIYTGEHQQDVGKVTIMNYKHSAEIVLQKI